MAQRDPRRPMTLQQYEALPYDELRRTEISAGFRVHEPLPGGVHARVSALLVHRLMQYEDAHPGVGRVLCDMGFVLQRQPPTVRGPDISFTRATHVLQQSNTGFFVGAPDIAIEVLSPSNRAAEMREKVAQYLKAGSVAVWVVDPRRKTVAVHEQTGSSVRRAGEVVTCEAVLPGFKLDIAGLFGDY